ncbi:MAG: CDP-alcohol phosphatidyltransferase family protein [Ruminococcus sp.]|nr:CDP-alcohol phosphatidyltransferase family protein [Ruminococcus sp.]
MENNIEKWSFKFSDLFTIPNILTYIRLVLIVPIAISYMNEQYQNVAFCIAFSGLTDCFDGIFARKFNQVTSLGKILDPIADKLTLLTVVICMVVKVSFMIPVLGVLIVKDLIMLIGGTDLLKKGMTPPPAKWYGKLATILFYFSVCLIVFLKAVFDIENYALDYLLLGISAVAMLFALYKYGKIYFAMIKEYNDKNSVTCCEYTNR